MLDFSWLFLAFMAVLALFILLRFLLPRPLNGEPPFILPHYSPFGHLIGLARQNMHYIVEIAFSNPNYPLFTLPFPLTRVYIVASPALLPEVDRNSRTLSLWSIESEVLTTLGGLNARTANILQQESFHEPFRRSISKSLSSTFSLDAINIAGANVLLHHLSSLGNGQKLHLWDLIKRSTMSATMTAIYGPDNPYASPDVQDGAWNLINAAHLATTRKLIHLFAPEAVAGREKVVEAMKTYLSHGKIDQASVLAQGRQKVMEVSRLDLDERARLESTFCFGLVGNTAPVAFWTLYHVLTTPSLLSTVRDEIETHITPLPPPPTPSSSPPAPATHTLNLTALRKSPLLTALTHEVLRFHSRSSGARRVTADTFLHPPSSSASGPAPAPFLLKAGAYLLAPTFLLHHGPQWGADARVFRPTRFLGAEGARNRGLFRGFGGGGSVCPGRHFAGMQVAVLLVLLVGRVEVVPVGAKGQGGPGGGWRDVEGDESKMFELVPPPVGEVEGEVRVREEWKGRRLAVVV